MAASLTVPIRGRMLRRLARDGSFRERVLRAYGYRCAVSGLGHRDFARFASGQVVDGAHLRPVGAGHGGGDETSNGLALTPSLHRLFDAGLFTLRYEGGVLRVQTSPELLHYDLAPLDTPSRLWLADGLPAQLPEQASWHPAPEALAYHQARIFRP